MAAAALLAFWPRRGGEAGFPLTALIVLVTLYAAPAIVLNFDDEFLRGALLALLVLAFLRLETLRRRDATRPRGSPRVAAIAALIAAPAARRPRARGGTTRAGPSTPRRRRPSPSTGITTTPRWTGRATAASCCA